MKVMAKPGTQCPKEGKPREYIIDSVAEEVPETAYYKRLVDDGSLVIPPESTTPTPPYQGGESKKKGGKE